MTGKEPDDSPFSTPELESSLQQRPSGPARRRPGLLVAIVATTALVAVGLIGALFVAGGENEPNSNSPPPAPIVDPLEQECRSASSELAAAGGQPALIVALLQQTTRRLAQEGENVDELVARWDAAAAALANAQAAAQRGDDAAYTDALDRATMEVQAGIRLAEARDLDECATFLQRTFEEFVAATQT